CSSDLTLAPGFAENGRGNLETVVAERVEILNSDCEPITEDPSIQKVRITLLDRTLNAREQAWIDFIVLCDDEIEISVNKIGNHRLTVGTFGELTTEQAENADGEFAAEVATGLSGLQYTHNEPLSGTDWMDITVNNSE